MSKDRRYRCGFGLMAMTLASFATASLVLSQVEGTPRQESHGEVPPGEIDATSDPWSRLKLLVGTWEGRIDGKLGRGEGVRRYELIMGDQFLLCRHQSVRMPQEKSPDGDQHEELGIFSFDGERNTIVLREFMSEGIVVRSTCEMEGTKIVCTSEAVEGGPGIRARLTLEIEDRYRFTERYQLAWPGRELEHYFTNHWTRSPPLPDSWS